jgi:(2Fe-2S) ferredoxin
VPKKYQILVCKGPDCGEKRRSIDILRSFESELKVCSLDGNEVALEQYSCFGRCKRGPNVLVREIKPNENLRLILLMPSAAAGAFLYHGVRPDECRRILEEHVRSGHPLLEMTKRNGPAK